MFFFVFSYNQVFFGLAGVCSKIVDFVPLHMFCSVAYLNLLRLAWFPRDPVQSNRGFMKMHDFGFLSLTDHFLKFF